LPQYLSSSATQAVEAYSSAAAEDSLRQSWYTRARAWLRQGKAKSWRPKARQRVKAFHFIKAFDNQLKKGLGWPDGLGHLQVTADGACQPPLRWPSASWCVDSGPDIIAALHFLTRDQEMLLNLDHVPDINHLAWNAAKRALKSSRLWGHQLLMLLDFIMRHGPFNQSSRMQQCSEGFEEYLSLARPWDCPIFNDLLPRLLRDKHRVQDMAQADIAHTVWEEMKEKAAGKGEGSWINKGTLCEAY
jgi:hypothetical protein